MAIGSIRTSVVQHPRVVRPVAARLLRRNRPTEADRILPGPSGRKRALAGTAPPPEAGAALRSRKNRPPELQEPLPLRAGTVRGSCPVPAVAAAGASAGAARPQAVPARSRAAPGSEGRRLLPSSASRGQLLPIIVSFLAHTSNYQLPADSSHDSPRTGCSPFPRPRRWALTHPAPARLF
jgi:hypothetical protein